MKKLLPFLILIFFALGCSEEARQQRREQQELEKQADARTKFANKMSEKFELPSSRRCVIDFFAEGEGNKTLRLRPCSVLTERGEKINLREVFEPSAMKEAKALGFTKMETERDGKTIFIPIE